MRRWVPALVNIAASVVVCALTACTRAQTSAAVNPVPAAIFFTDLLSGPASGGESDGGAFVTLYGTGFGAERGQSVVTVGGGPVRSYPVWSDTRVTVQLGSAAKSGALKLQQRGLSITAPQSFTVRPGRILFVSPTGSDQGKGTAERPWKTLLHARDELRAGDITYVREGVVQSGPDRYDSSLAIMTSGSEGRPIAMVAYPGERPVIGAADGQRIAMRTPNVERTSDHWVLAGFRLVGAMQALDLTASDDWRIIANEFTCPNGFGPDGCVETATVRHVAFLGNFVHDISRPRTGKSYHAVYFSSDSNGVEVGWNTIARVRACRGLQFHSSPIGPGTGRNQYALNVHDNIIHDTVCDGINLATIDPSKGPVIVRQNLIFRAGTGPDPEDGSADYACLYVQGGANEGPPGTGNVEVSHNTFADCGGRGNTDSGLLSFSGGSPGQRVDLRENIVVSSTGAPLLTAHSIETPLRAEHNFIRAGNTSVLSMVSQRLHAGAEPLFRDPAADDFTLRPGSPAAGFGAPVEQLSTFVCGLWPSALARCESPGGQRSNAAR